MLRLDEILYLPELSNDRPVFFVLLVQDLRVLEVVDEAVESLQSGVGEVTNLGQQGGTFSLRNLAHFLSWKAW